MKRCPKCKREFPDDLRFCLEDGTPLTGAELGRTIAAPTMVLPVEDQQAPTMSHAGRPDVPLPGFQKHDFGRTTQSSGSALTARFVGVVLLILVAIANVVGAIVIGGATTRRIPLTLAFTAVMLFAIIRAPRHPKVSLLVTAALGFDLIETFVYTLLLTRVLPTNFYQVLAILDSCVAGGVIVMLTLAVLSERTSQSAIN